MGPFDPFSTDFFDSGIGGTIGGTFGDFDFQLDPNAPSTSSSIPVRTSSRTSLRRS